jgi:hypothetical protein
MAVPKAGPEGGDERLEELAILGYFLEEAESGTAGVAV